jgi:GNAT superfamily N-acetyltransferase
MTMTFAPAPPDQLVAVDALMRAAFTPYVRALGREIAPGSYDWFADAIVKGDIFVAHDGLDLVGAITTKRGDRDLSLEQIGVAPARQKQGIASWMIGQIEPIARGRGCRTLSLNTAEMMEDRVRLYTRHGFRIVRRGPPEHGRDAHVRVYMVKEIAR